MSRYNEGDRVKVDIPDTTDPDFETYHGRHGTITDVTEDELGGLTGDKQDNFIYQVELDNGEEKDFRWKDLRPLLEE